ncbi:MAG: universal stress protein [Paludibacteraceae bacterium]|nr:universal stress protein [Paludibacteraceae bacterium]
MEDKLVTLAIRTYQRAQMIKSVLEENGIDTVIHNLNLEQPEMAVGVRVRIRQSDLPRALKLVEDIESEWTKDEIQSQEAEVLIPFDFADPVDKTIDLGFSFAERLNAEVVLMYVYFSPAFTISAHNDLNTYSISDSELLRRIIGTAKADMENMTNRINTRIANGELPDLPFRFELREGVPEDQILDYCKKNKPVLVVMGTHGKKITAELIGSVTADVMESSQVPVFAVPNIAPLDAIDTLKRIAFLTNFDQKDLIAIDKTIELFNSDNLEIYFIHASEKNENWNEVILSGIKSYFASHYPGLITHYALIGSPDNPDVIEDYLKQKKVELLALNSRRRKLFSRLFNPGLAYKMVLNSDTPMFVTHV